MFIINLIHFKRHIHNMGGKQHPDASENPFRKVVTNTTSQLPISPAHKTVERITQNAAEKAWVEVSKDLKEKERQRFESYSCNDWETFSKRIHTSCSKTYNDSILNKANNWLRPLYDAVKLFTPAMVSISQAYPNPAAVIIGGVLGAIAVADQFENYQYAILNTLRRMSLKTEKFKTYERSLFTDDPDMFPIMVKFHRAILLFCVKALRIVKTKDKPQKNGLRSTLQTPIAKIKNLKFIPFRDFNSIFKVNVDDFESVVLELEDKAQLYLAIKQMKSATITEDIKTTVNQGFSAIEKLLAEQQLFQQRKQRQKQTKLVGEISEWISKIDSVAAFERHCEERLQGTAKWLFSEHLYNTWKSSRHSDLLWITGRPGRGKSVLAAATINELQRNFDDDSEVAYVFCERPLQAIQTPKQLLSSLTRQLMTKDKPIPSDVEEEYRNKRSDNPPSLQAIRRLFQYYAMNKKIFIVIDALDECLFEDQNVFAKELVSLLRNHSNNNIKIIIFSRPSRGLESLFKFYHHIHIVDSHVERDLKAYINFEFFEDSDELKNEYFIKSEGLLLWVSLIAITFKRNVYTLKDRKNRLNQMIGGLGSVYQIILQEIQAMDTYIQDRELRLLLWVMFAKRPLSARSLAEAIADYTEVKSLENLNCYSSSSDLQELCKNLIFLNEENKIQLIHESLRSYMLDSDNAPGNRLISRFQYFAADVNTWMATTCLDYLSLEDFDFDIKNIEKRKRKEMLLNCNLLYYAARYWGDHALEAGKKLHSIRVKKLLESDSIRYIILRCRNELYFKVLETDGRDHHEKSNIFHVISCFGLMHVAEEIEIIYSLLNEPDNFNNSPLDYAIQHQNLELARWITEKFKIAKLPTFDNIRVKYDSACECAKLGWDDILDFILHSNMRILQKVLKSPRDEEIENEYLNEKENDLYDNSYGNTLLTEAASAGNTSTVEMLLILGVDQNLKSTNCLLPLHAAVLHSHLEVVKLLIQHGADAVIADDLSGLTPALVAVQQGNIAILEALFESKTGSSAIWTTVTEIHDSSLLHEASKCDNLDCLRFLHHKYGKLDIKTPKSKINTLHFAVSANKLENVRYLLSNGIDINEAHELTGSTLLHIAAKNGHFQIFNFLLKEGCIVKGNFNGETPLHFAMAAGHWNIVELLLRNGTNHIAKDHDGENSFFQSCYYGTLDCAQQYIKLCRQMGLHFDPNDANSKGQSYCDIAILYGHEDFAFFLLENGATITVSEKKYSPTHKAAQSGMDKVLQKLLDRDDIIFSTKDELGRSPLQYASSSGLLQTVELLANAQGVSLNDQDIEGNTALNTAIKNRNSDVARYLLSLPLDPNISDNKSVSPLFHAQQLGNLELVREIITAGANIRHVDSDGRTALHYCVSQNGFEIANILHENGLKDFDARDKFGWTCGHVAAASGNLLLLRFFLNRGASIHSKTFLGRSIEFIAAQNGQVEILEWMAVQKSDLDFLDLTGHSAAEIAASHGYTAVLKWISKQQPVLINRPNPIDQRTPLLCAAMSCFPTSMNQLLQDGADAEFNNCHGVTVNSLIKDYSFMERTQRGCLVQRFAYLSYVTQDSLDSRIDMLRVNQICRAAAVNACLKLISFTNANSYVGLTIRSRYLRVLFKALLKLNAPQDAKICCMDEGFFYEDHQYQWQCTYCEEKFDTQDMYICKSCPLKVHCQKCHPLYLMALNYTPDYLLDLMQLETEVWTYRRLIPIQLSLYEVTKIFIYFGIRSYWITQTLERYRDLKQSIHDPENANFRFRNVKNPGYDFISLISEAIPIVEAIITDPDPSSLHINSLLEIEQLSQTYDVLKKKFRPDQEPKNYGLCYKHEHVHIASGEYDAIFKSGTLLNTVNKRINEDFLLDIMAAYNPTTEEREAIQKIQRQTTLPVSNDSEIKSFRKNWNEFSMSTPARQLTGQLQKSSTIKILSNLDDISYKVDQSSKSNTDLEQWIMHEQELIHKPMYLSTHAAHTRPSKVWEADNTLAIVTGIPLIFEPGQILIKALEAIIELDYVDDRDKDRLAHEQQDQKDQPDRLYSIGSADIFNILSNSYEMMFQARPASLAEVRIWALSIVVHCAIQKETLLVLFEFCAPKVRRDRVEVEEGSSEEDDDDDDDDEYDYDDDETNVYMSDNEE